MNDLYSYNADIWSLGVLTYRLLTVKYPFEPKNLRDLKAKVLQ